MVSATCRPTIRSHRVGRHETDRAAIDDPGGAAPELVAVAETDAIYRFVLAMTELYQRYAQAPPEAR